MEIGIWGDSITYGGGDSEALGWVGRLRKAIEQTRSDVGVYNFGVCGDTTEDLLKRFETEAESIHPQIVIFAIGTNDSRRPGGSDVSEVPLEQYKENIQKLVTLAKEHTKQIYLVGLTQVDEVNMRASGTVFQSVILATYNECLSACAEEIGVSFLDLWNAIDPKTDLDDGLHPNAQGYQKMFESIWSRIKPLP